MAKGDIAVIEIDVIDVAYGTALLTRESGWVIALAIGKIPGKRVATCELKAAREALIDCNGNGFIKEADDISSYRPHFY